MNFKIGKDGVLLSQGVVGADGPIVLSGGQDVSLNLNKNQILSYIRNGQALEITLVDGQVIVIEGFMSPEGVVQNKLFLSEGGRLESVDIVAGEGALLYPEYASIVADGKWSTVDELYFFESGAVASGLEFAAAEAVLGGLGPVGLGAVGLGAAALLTGGGGSSNSGSDGSDGSGVNLAITGGTQSVGHVVNGDEYMGGVEVTGTGTPGAAGTITIGGASQDIIIDQDGNWTATFSPDDLPDGDYSEDVSVTVDLDGDSATIEDVLDVDTIVDVTFDADIIGTDGVVNSDEEAEGLTLTGTNEPGATISVVIDDIVYDAVVDGETWSLDLAPGIIDQGEYDLEVTVNATDQNGNSRSLTENVVIDTVVDLAMNEVDVGGSDGVVNSAEAAAGVTFNGSVDIGSSVFVSVNGGGEVAASVNSTGAWSVTFADGSFGEISGTAEISVRAVDPAGNETTVTDSFIIDTEVPTAADVESITTGDTATLAYTALSVGADAAVESFSYVDGSDVAPTLLSGEARVTGSGQYGFEFDQGAGIPNGSHLVINIADSAGNENATFVALDEDGNSQVALDWQALTEFDIGAIDLEFAEDSTLTLSPADIIGLSENNDGLIIHGGIDDTVILTGTASSTGTREINGQQYDVYSIGDGEAEMILSSDVNFSHSVF